MSFLTCLPPQPWSAEIVSTATSRTNIFSIPDSTCDLSWPGGFTMWLDQSDRVMSLPSPWDAFAEMSGLPTAQRDLVLGRPVGWFIADDTARECFRVLFERIRRERRTAKIVSRCDTLSAPRALQVAFVPMAAGAIECSWAFLDESTAGEIRPVPPRHFADGEHLRMCSWCRQVHMRVGWQRLETAGPALGLLDHRTLPPITHGICPQCSASLHAENAAVIRERLAV